MAKTILRWPGAKWRMADWVINIFPRHNVYCEPFFGSGAVFFSKRPAENETINDIDGNIINLFRVVRDIAPELAKVIEMTPYSREEYYSSLNDIQTENQIETARRFLVRIWQGFGGTTNRQSGWRHDRSGTVYLPRYWSELPDRIRETAGRLKMAQIENMDALRLIESYNRPGVLLYIDPPYLAGTRTRLHYQNEFASEKQHLELLQLCRQHRGFLLISAYENELYNQELRGWEKKSIVVSTNGTNSATETIYLNPACTREISLFE